MKHSHTEFEKLLENSINLTPTERKQGSKSHNHIRDLLKNKSEKDSSFPWLLGEDFLSGSFAKKIKIRPLDDIDVIMVLDGAGLRIIKNGLVQTGLTVKGGQNYYSSPIHKMIDQNGLISSKKVLEKFAEALKETYPNESKIRTDEQAVNVWLDSYGMGLDIVPALHVTPLSQEQGTYYIPQGDRNQPYAWLETDPKTDMEIFDKLHNRHNSQLKPVMRLIKHWASQTHDDRLKSYHLEAVVRNIFAGRKDIINYYSEAVHYFFQHAHMHFNFQCPDPVGIGNPVDNYLKLEDRREIIRSLLSAKETSNRAILLETQGRQEQALKEWRKIFTDL